MKRVFFDWDRPFLPAVAKYIVETGIRKAVKPRELDLGKYVYILSGQRAIRTLESYVQLEAQNAVEAGLIEPDWTPPVYVKLGAAPEEFYTPAAKIAGRLTRLYCMRQAAMKFFAARSEEAKILLPNPPKTFAAQLELGSTFLKLKEELDSERKTYVDLEEYCAKYEPTDHNGQILDRSDDAKRWRYDEAKRWRALAEIDKAYSLELKIHGMTDLNNARLAALKTIGDPEYDAIDGVPREYRVIGAVDLNKLQKSVFEKLAERVEFWVFAPESENEAFDDYGCVIPDAWETRPVPLQDSQLFQVDSPVEQGEAVELLVRELSKRYDADGNWRYEPIDPYSLTVGVPDREVVPFVESRLQNLGYAAVVGEGSPMTQNRAYQLLENLADYIETRSFSAFEELLRRYDLGVFFRNNWDKAYPEGLSNAQAEEEEEEEEKAQSEEEQTDAPAPFQAAEDDIGTEDEESPSVTGEAPAPQDEIEKREESNSDWLRDLDDYRANYMPMRVDGYWFKHDDQDNSKRSRRFVSLRKASDLLNRVLLFKSGFWACESGRDAILRSNASSEDPEDLQALRIKIPNYTAEDDPFTGDLAVFANMFDEKTRWSANQNRRSLRAWAQPLSTLMCAIYGSKRYPDPEAQAQIDGFFKAFNKALYELNDVPTSLADDMTGADAIRVVLKQIASERTDPSPQEDPIELQGWLDLLFDDAPDLVLTGFNEGSIPSNRSSDLFLPNETRGKIGLNDSKRAFARDAYLTTVLLNCRRNFFAVFEKKSLNDDPKTPSRFIFAADKTTIPERVVKYFADDCSETLDFLRARQLDKAGEIVPFPLKKQELEIYDDEEDLVDDPDFVQLARKAESLRTAAVNALELGFSAPTLELAKRSPFDLKTMNVTDFEKFLDSPYRFFLRKVYKLNPSGDPNALELNAANFGNIVHDVLRAFGTSKAKDYTDPIILGNWLVAELERRSRSFQNEYTSPFMQIQLKQIASRLRSFADWQARWRKLGMEIAWVEKGPKDGKIEFNAFDTDINVVGRIDRIDRSPDGKNWFVFDYKTFNSYKVGPARSDELSAWPELLTKRAGNTVDYKHRVKANESKPAPLHLLQKHGLNVGVGASDEEEEQQQQQQFAWINLQLPLYRRLFMRIFAEEYDISVETAQSQFAQGGRTVDFAYIVLPKSGDVKALGAAWNERDFKEADAAAAWVVRSIKRLCQGDVRPTDFIDKENKALGRVLDNSKLKYEDDFAPITLSYTNEQ